MPVLSPFQPYRYNPDHVDDLGAVIAPPYDVISPEKRRALMGSDPHNVIQLILPEGDDQTKYVHAGELFRAWIEQGVLTRETGRALYPYAQIFSHPVTGDRIERRGFIGTVELSPFSEGKILPHERTLSGPKADRLKLMLATDANLEAIFGVYRDPDGVSSARIDRICSHTEPFLAVTDSDGVEHRLWRATDAAELDGFASDLRDARVFIVDGHHRYETALNYQRLRREELAETSGAGAGSDAASGGAPYDSIMIFLAPSSDPGLVILPTHRIVHSLESFSLDALLDAIRPSFEVTEMKDRGAALEALESSSDRPSYLLLADGRMVVARLSDGASLDALVDAELPAALKGLDVTLLHNYIFERVLGITQGAQAEQRNLHYVKSADEAFNAAAESANQLVVLMNATKLSQVEDVAESGTVMPQKSTYFYPKLASGLLFNELRG